MPAAIETRRGLAYGASAYLLWGLFPLYWPLLEPAGPLEILAHRIVWSLIFVAIVLACTTGFGGVRTLLATPRQRNPLMLAAVVITVNWGVYIWGVNSHHVVETSLGYFVNPLFTILLGVFVLGERLRRAQWVAVGIGTIAIVVISVDYGRPPWFVISVESCLGI